MRAPASDFSKHLKKASIQRSTAVSANVLHSRVSSIPWSPSPGNIDTFTAGVAPAGSPGRAGTGNPTLRNDDYTL